MVVVKRAILVVIAIGICVLAGCFEWTEDPHGNLQSVGLPGVPVWKSKTPPTPMTPAEMGYTPEEAAKISGPILVEPPDASAKNYRYRYYQTGHNNCQEDLQKILADRATSNAAGPLPYCTDTASASSSSSSPASDPSQSVPASPPAAKGGAFVF
jgi:hypothetical protein